MSNRIFRKKPVEIEAFRLAIDNIPDWFMDKVSSNDIILRGEYRDLQSCEINTLEGVMVGNKGDYIIKGVKGEIYPCKPDIFEATYEGEGLNETEPFFEGNKVKKKGGYNFRGVVVAAFTKLNGQERYVVECTVPGCEGMLHIYNGSQLEDDNE